MAIINYIEKHLITFNVKVHTHHFWEIISVTEGEGVFSFENNASLKYSKGDIVCIPPNLKHENCSQTGFKNIHFTMENWNCPLENPFLIRSSDFTKELYSLTKLAYRYFHKLPASHQINIALTNTIEAFLNTFVENTENKATDIIIKEIINNYTDINFDVKQALKLIPLSEEYARKLFIKENHISPTKFLLLKRLDLAKQLLAMKGDYDFRIKEIAYSCGFTDFAYFCRVFKKETGVSPKNYQLNLLDNNKVFDK